MLPGSTAPFLGGGQSGGENDANTFCMLHFDGANGSTTITDNNGAAAARTWATFNGSTISTAQSKFGGSSLLTNGSNNGVSVANTTMQNAGGDFTYDWWFYCTGGAGSVRCFMSMCNSSGQSGHVFLRLSAANVLECGLFTGATTFTSITGTTAISLNTWYHAAFVRTGNILKLFLNGVQEGGDVAFSGSPTAAAGTCIIGRLGDFNGQYFGGHIDEFRWSKVARWLGTFQPPTRAYVP